MSKSKLNPALEAIAAALNAQRDAAQIKFDAFENDVLVNRLITGLHCLKAHVLFSISDPGKRGQGRKGKNQVTRDGISTEGFEGWLATEVAWLKKPTAYKYMTAFKGLGLSDTATEEEVETALKQNRRIGPVSLKSLCDAAVERIGPPAASPEPPQQSEFDFLRDSLAAYRSQSECLLGLKAQLTGCPDLLKAACARAYTTLKELTGSEWAPSDHPDALADVDPDSISLA